jgi:hypothetical protein
LCFVLWLRFTKAGFFKSIFFKTEEVLNPYLSILNARFTITNAH